MKSPVHKGIYKILVAADLSSENGAPIARVSEFSLASIATVIRKRLQMEVETIETSKILPE